MHRIEILRAPYVLQLFFSDFWGMFSAQNSNVFVQEFFFSLLKTVIFLLFSKMKTNFSWTNTSEFWAENMPQKSEKKVEEHKVSSEFRSDA